jgi:hypothetical protein
MGISAAFLNELSAQRAAALHELQEARAAGNDADAALAVARLRDRDELLARTASSDVQLDGDLVEAG